MREAFVKFRHLHEVLSVSCVHQVQARRPKCGMGVVSPFASCEFMSAVTCVHLCRVLLILLDGTQILPITWNCFLRGIVKRFVSVKAALAIPFLCDT